MKTEILSASPPITQFYDVLSNKLIAKIKKAVAPTLSISGLYGNFSLEDSAKFRTSVFARLPAECLMELWQISDLITGLTMTGAEYPLVFEYTYGRFYSYHTDVVKGANFAGRSDSFLNIYGERFAVLIFYVSCFFKYPV